MARAAGRVIENPRQMINPAQSYIYLKKSTDRKAQISPLTRTIFSGKVYHPERTISFSMSNSFWYYR